MIKMTKEEVQKRVLKRGQPLALDLFTWDEKTKTFSSKEWCLCIDFKHINGCTFNTEFYCNFETGSGCTFKTGNVCNFETGSGCTFYTGDICTFKTGSDCTLNTGYDCTFDVGDHFNFISRCGVYAKADSYEVTESKKGQKNKLKPRRFIGHTYFTDYWD